MTCVSPIIQGGYDAQVHQHLDPGSSLSLRRRVLPAPPQAPRRQEGHRSNAPDHPLRRRRTHLLALRYLQATSRCPRRGGGRGRALRDAARLQALETTGQCRPGRAPAQAAPQTGPDRGPRPHVAPLLRRDAKENDQIYRSQAKRGTCSFYAYASAYIVHKGQRYTVGSWRSPASRRWRT